MLEYHVSLQLLPLGHCSPPSSGWDLNWTVSQRNAPRKARSEVTEHVRSSFQTAYQRHSQAETLLIRPHNMLLPVWAWFPETRPTSARLPDVTAEVSTRAEGAPRAGGVCRDMFKPISLPGCDLEAWGPVGSPIVPGGSKDIVQTCFPWPAVRSPLCSPRCLSSAQAPSPSLFSELLRGSQSIPP